MVRRQSTSSIVDPAIQGEYVDPESSAVPTSSKSRTTPARRASFQAQAVSFQGPIPPPELLREYNEIIPDGADRIVKMAEAQSSHRIELERIVIKGDDRRANWGLVTGYSIGVLIIVLSFILILYGHGMEGTVLGTIDLVSLVGVFVYGRRSRVQELARRDQKNKNLTRRK